MTTQITNALTQNNLQFDFVGTDNTNNLVVVLPKATNKLQVARILKSLELEFVITIFGFEITTQKEIETPIEVNEYNSSNFYFEDASIEDDFDYSNF